MKDEFFGRTVEEVIEKKSFQKKLASGKKLRIKIGADPTSPDIHLGHAVSLWNLKKLQDLGHTIIFLIGDYTTRIGDPSGKSKTRPMLSEKEIKDNAKTYFEQVGKILNLKETEIRYNSEWYNKFGLSDIIEITAKFTVAQIIERDDFEKRLKSGNDVGIHEVLYPIMQAYDSVMLNSDIEFGGTDQKFNMLAGRSLQKKMNQSPQDVVTVKLLIGLDGKNKMSKSLGNYIGIMENSESMFGKVMSIPDDLILDYFQLCTLLDDKEIKKIEKQLKEGKNPRDIKEQLAIEIVKLYHNSSEAKKAALEFKNVFSKKQLPKEMPKISLKGNYPLPLLLIKIGVASSNSKARRLISQGALKVDGAKLSDPNSEISIASGMVIQVGKQKYFKIK